MTIRSETFLLAALIEDDGTHSLSGPLASGKAKSFSFLLMGLIINKCIEFNDEWH